MRVAITGVTGLVGEALYSALTTYDFFIRAIVRPAVKSTQTIKITKRTHLDSIRGIIGLFD